MNVVVAGQGAMGLLWYHHLSQLITLTGLSLLPSNQAPSATNHYHFTDIKGIKTQKKVHFAQAEHIQSADVILLCVKSFQVFSVLKNIEKHLKPNTSILLAHNGMGTLDELPQSLIMQHSIFTLLTTHGCLRTAPFTITHTGLGVSDFGLLSGEIDNNRQQAITSLLNTALPEVMFHKNIKEKQWLKLAINCVINPLTALHNIENGKINNNCFTKQVSNILTEIVLVAKSEGIELSLTSLIAKVQQVAQATAENSSSMRCDILANRATEIDYINGYLHRLGITHNISTPENTQLWQAVKSLTQ